MKKTIKKICIDCDNVFTALSNKALRCPDCKAMMQVQYQKNFRLREKRRCRSKNSATISDILRELDEYNATHGTSLSYGKYLLLKGSDDN